MDDVEEICKFKSTVILIFTISRIWTTKKKTNNMSSKMFGASLKVLQIGVDNINRSLPLRSDVFKNKCYIDLKNKI